MFPFWRMISAGSPGTFGKIEGFSGILPVVAHPVKIVAIAPPETFKKFLLEMGISAAPQNSLNLMDICFPIISKKAGRRHLFILQRIFRGHNTNTPSPFPPQGKRDGVRRSYTAVLQKEFVTSRRRKATWRVAPGEEIVEGIIREIFKKGYKSEKSAQ